MSFVEFKQKKEKKIFSKQFVTSELTKYGLKFSVLSIIINERNKSKNVIMKKENKIFSKQFFTTEPTKYGLSKKTFQWMSFVNVEKI